MTQPSLRFALGFTPGIATLPQREREREREYVGFMPANPQALGTGHLCLVLYVKEENFTWTTEGSPHCTSHSANIFLTDVM